MASNNNSNGFGIALGFLAVLIALGAWNSGALDWLLGDPNGQSDSVTEADLPSFNLPDFLTPGQDDDSDTEPAEDAPKKEPEANDSDGVDGNKDEPAPEEADAVADPSVDVAATMAALDTLDIKGRAPKTGYDRDLFAHWTDPDANSCDTRNDILARDLTDTVLDPDDCTVLTGVLDDPYTGQSIDFQRGQSTSSAVQIEHVVALMDAWQKGAQSWDSATREKFANDPAGLLAVDGPANMSKGAADAATWLPPNKAFRCEYVATQVDIKAKYDLWVTAAEHDAIERVLNAC